MSFAKRLAAAPGFGRILAVFVLAAFFGPFACAQSKNLAPGFSSLPGGAKVLLLPVDVELFSISAGGIPEPRADWTADAQKFMDAALSSKLKGLNLDLIAVDEKAADDFAEQVGLHAAVARSIDIHHSIGGTWALPSKQGKLDWSFDDAMVPLQQRFGAQYGLFAYVRDSYASNERKVAMVALALLGVGLSGGAQVGYASLVDLKSGRVIWFSHLARASGDLRERSAAAESVDALMTGFPAGR